MKEFIEKIRTYHSEKMNFEALADFIESNNFKISFTGFKMPGVTGMTLFDEIFIKDIDDKEKMFITILHEIAHCKIALNLGYDKHVEFHNQTLSDMDFTLVMDEEVLADRYAEYSFYRFNGYICKRYNQNLNKTNVRNRYQSGMESLYYGLPKDIESLNEFAKINILC